MNLNCPDFYASYDIMTCISFYFQFLTAYFHLAEIESGVVFTFLNKLILIEKINYLLFFLLSNINEIFFSSN